METDNEAFIKKLLDDYSSLQKDFFLKESAVIDEVGREVK